MTGSWDPVTATQHINFKKLKVVKLALEMLGPIVASKSTALFLDSVTTVSVLKGLYIKIVVLRKLLQHIFRLLGHYRFWLKPVHIAG